MEAQTRSARTMLNKVPEVTVYFWIIKVLATTVGETAADLLSMTLHLGEAWTGLIMTMVLVVSLFYQFRSRRYVPGFYWLSVVLISIVGTLLSDNLVDNLGVPLTVTTPVFAAVLTATFMAWYASEKTLSIHTIFTTRREWFYWLTVLATFALGTSGGDFLSEALRWGYFNSLLIFAGGIGLVTFSFYFLRLNAVAAFWIAYVLTRPLGASLGDLMSQTHSAGGLGLGTIWTSVVFLLAILALVTYLAMTKVDVTPTSATPPTGVDQDAYGENPGAQAVLVPVDED
jgi:uncharacterized membrane-anchored protein